MGCGMRMAYLDDDDAGMADRRIEMEKSMENASRRRFDDKACVRNDRELVMMSGELCRRWMDVVVNIWGRKEARSWLFIENNDEA